MPPRPILSSQFLTDFFSTTLPILSVFSTVMWLMSCQGECPNTPRLPAHQTQIFHQALALGELHCSDLPPWDSQMIPANPLTWMDVRDVNVTACADKCSTQMKDNAHLSDIFRPFCESFKLDKQCVVLEVEEHFKCLTFS